MPAVAALLDSRSALLALRRTLAPGPPVVVACRSAAGLARALNQRLLDAVVIGHRALRSPALITLRTQFPALPMVAYGQFRPDDGEVMHRLEQPGGVSAIAVEGVDDPVVGDLVRARSLAAERRDVLGDGPRLLRLTEEIQRRAWSVVISEGAGPVLTGQVARRLTLSREHLSRQFAAGGAPNLKRVLDMVRIVTAAQLLANPGYGLPDAVRLLRFSSSSHLHATSRRVAGIPAGELAAAGPRGVFLAFARDAARRRSRA